MSNVADIEYYRPATAEQAVATFQGLASSGKKPVYYSGGTEILAAAREGTLEAGALIDIKAIPEARVMERIGQDIVAGASVALNEVIQSGMFPMLREACRAVADHTSRNRITLGGNLSGQIPYREALLPVLAAGGSIVLAGPQGRRLAQANELVGGASGLGAGEFVLQVVIPVRDADLPHVFLRQTRLEKMAYPLVSIAAIKDGAQIRAAFAGVCGSPFRSSEVERDLSETSLPIADRLNKAVSHLPAPILSDYEGSAQYREVVLRKLLGQVMTALES